MFVVIDEYDDENRDAYVVNTRQEADDLRTWLDRNVHGLPPDEPDTLIAVLEVSPPPTIWATTGQPEFQTEADRRSGMAP